MSLNLKEWFDTNPVPKESIAKPVTQFPVTFHDYTEAYADDVPTDNPKPYINNRMIHAHSLISDDCVSPYLAWAIALGYEGKNLPSLLRMDENSCRYLINNGQISPPPEKIQDFCKRIGVHPAYLLPVFQDEHCLCHYQILRTVAKIYKDPSMTYHDRDIARKCLTIERDRFIRLEKENRVAYSYMKVALENIKGLPTEIFSSLAKEFPRVANNPASDIDLGLDIIEIDQENKILRDTIEWEHIVDASDEKYRTLLKFADVLFEKAVAQENLNTLISGIYDAEDRYSQSLHWGWTDQGTITGDNSYEPSVHINGPKLRIDFELLSMNSGCNPEAIKKHFVEILEDHVSLLLKKDRLHLSIEHAKVGLEKNIEWRYGSDARSIYIPIVANYILADRALGRQLLISGPAQEEPLTNQTATYANNEIK